MYFIAGASCEFCENFHAKLSKKTWLLPKWRSQQVFHVSAVSNTWYKGIALFKRIAVLKILGSIPRKHMWLISLEFFIFFLILQNFENSFVFASFHNVWNFYCKDSRKSSKITENVNKSALYNHQAIRR